MDIIKNALNAYDSYDFNHDLSLEREEIFTKPKRKKSQKIKVQSTKIDKVQKNRKN